VERISLIKRMLAERRLGFLMDELMQGTHHFVNGFGPEGEHEMFFEVTWGTRHLANYLNPFGANFMSNFLEGTITVGGLVERAACRGTLDLKYFSEAKIRYKFTFKDDKGVPYRYVGEKVNIRPWNLHRTHTTCYGTITNLETGKDISKSILYFKLDTVPAFIKSVRLG
jgi:hypothetical protein